MRSDALNPALVMAPVSPALADLLHQVQAQIIREAQERTDDGKSIVVLERAPVRPAASSQWGDTVTLEDGRGGSAFWARRRFCPESWLPDRLTSGVFWHPSHWRCSERRMDSRGRRWELEDAVYVVDDFGDLVPVPEHLQ